MGGKNINSCGERELLTDLTRIEEMEYLSDTEKKYLTPLATD